MITLHVTDTMIVWSAVAALGNVWLIAYLLSVIVSDRLRRYRAHG